MPGQKRLFSTPYLNKGSSGGAVRWLQSALKLGGYNYSIDVDGIYGDQTALGVQTLQRALGFKGGDLDGNFGPQTRQALKDQRMIDVEALYVDELTEETIAVGP